MSSCEPEETSAFTPPLPCLLDCFPVYLVCAVQRVFTENPLALVLQDPLQRVDRDGGGGGGGGGGGSAPGGDGLVSVSPIISDLKLCTVPGLHVSSR